MDKTNIAVIGAGIAGVTATYYLAKQGYDVTVYDQEPYSGMKCSYANGGQLSVSNSETWHSWANVVKGIKWLTKKDAPLLIRPGLDIDRAMWIIRFLKNIATDVREKNTIKTIELGLESRELYKEIAAEEHIDFDLTQSGILHFYKDETYFQAAKNAQQMYEDNGCEWEILNQAQVFEKEPLLHKDQSIVGGAWTKSDMMGDIHKFCTKLSVVLRTRYGVLFQYNANVSKEKLKEIRSQHDAVVISAGAETAQLASYLGDSCTIYPVKGYSVTINSDASILPRTSLLDDQAKIVTSTLGNRFRVAGTAELNGYNYDILKDRVEPLLNWVHQNFPHVSTKDYSSWACLRPMTADMMPMIKKSKQKNVYYHSGHGHLGWTLSPATAKRLVALINEDQ